MIRHAFCQAGSAPAVSALAITMIEPPFGRLLMAAVGGAALNAARQSAAGDRAINLPAFTRGADEEDIPATGSQAEALAEGRRTLLNHVEPRSGWTAETEGGKIKPL